MKTTVVLILLMLLTACANPGGGKLVLRSQMTQGVSLPGGFESGTYRFDDANHVTFVLLHGPADNPDQALTIRLFWRPQAGKTPIDPTATDATMNYIIFSGPERKVVGVYSGAGYVYPSGTLGNATLSGAVWEANLQLTDASPGFADLLGPALLEGKFNARRDDLGTDETIRRLNVMLRERFGYPRLVRAQL